MFYLETDMALHKLGHFLLCHCVLFVAILYLDHILFCVWVHYACFVGSWGWDLSFYFASRNATFHFYNDSNMKTFNAQCMLQLL